MNLAVDRSGSAHSPSVMLVALLLASFVSTVSVLMVITMLPELATSLHASTTATQWVYLSFAVMGPVGLGLLPTIGSVVGQRQMLIVALVSVLVGAVLGAAAPNITVLIVARFIGALGIAAIGISLAMIRSLMPSERETSSYGWIVVAAGLAAGVGFVADGVLVEVIHANWRATFWGVGVLVVIAIAVVIAVVPDTPRRQVRSIDYPGALTLTAAIAATMVAITQGSHWGWTSAAIIILLVGGVATAALWVFMELRAAEPLVRLALIASKTVALGVPFYFIASAMPVIVNVTVPQFLELPSAVPYGLGASPLSAGLLLLPFALVNALTGYLAGRSMDRTGPRPHLLIFGVFTTGGWILLAGAHSSYLAVAVAMALVGVGYGTGSAAAFTLIMRGGHREAAGETAGISLISGNLANGIVSAVVVALLTARFVPLGTAAVPAESGYVNGWILAAVISGIGLLLTLVTYAAVRKPSAPTATPAQATVLSEDA